MADEDRNVHIMDVKRTKRGLNVTMRVARNGPRLELLVDELQAKLGESRVTWKKFVEALGDFGRWVNAPSHRKSFPEYTEDRQQALADVKAQLKLDVVREEQPCAMRLDAAREPKRSVMRHKDSVTSMLDVAKEAGEALKKASRKKGKKKAFKGEDAVDILQHLKNKIS